jgi:hypothetical protein
MGSCAMAGSVPRALLVPARSGYLGLEERRVPVGFELGEGEFYGAFRIVADDQRIVAPVVLTVADQLDLLHFLDILDRVTGGFPYRRTYVLPGGDLAFGALVEGQGHRARRWALEIRPTQQGDDRLAVLDLDAYVVGRVAWDVVEFLPGVTDADMDWPNLSSDVLIAVGERLDRWQPLQRDDGSDHQPLRFPVQALAGHLERGDTAAELLQFVETELRKLRVEPDHERESSLITDLVAWRETSRTEQAEAVFERRQQRVRQRG